MSDLTRAPNGAYLIESAPRYRQYLAAKDAREIVQRVMTPLAILLSAVSGYRDEMYHMLDAEAIYLGPGK